MRCNKNALVNAEAQIKRWRNHNFPLKQRFKRKRLLPWHDIFLGKNGRIIDG